MESDSVPNRMHRDYSHIDTELSDYILLYVDACTRWSKAKTMDNLQAVEELEDILWERGIDVAWLEPDEELLPGMTDV